MLFTSYRWHLFILLYFCFYHIHKRTTMSTNNILEVLEFYLCYTYFLFLGQFNEQTKGTIMGSPVSPVVANLYMEYFECRALTSAVNPPSYGRGMQMTLMSYYSNHRRKNSCNTSTLWILPSSSPQKNPGKMVPCHSWTHLLCHKKMEP